jgi:hypothetical protein
MTHEERGLYISLLCVQWSQGSVSEDDIKRITGSGFKGSIEHVKTKFEEVNGQFKNPRLEIERQKQADFRSKQALNGRKGGRPRKKGLGYSGLTQTKAKKSSPSPSPSPSPDSDLRSPVRTSASRFARPSIEEIKSRAHEIGLPETEAFKFHAYYESNGWRVGKNPMQSWRGAMQTWKISFEEGRYERTNQQHGGQHSQPIKPVIGSVPNNGF